MSDNKLDKGASARLTDLEHLHTLVHARHYRRAEAGAAYLGSAVLSLAASALRSALTLHPAHRRGR